MPEDIHWKNYAGRFKTLPELLLEEPGTGIKAIVCIPVFAEPDVITTLKSLINCKHSDFRLEVILLYNTSIFMNDDERVIHEKSWKECVTWTERNKADWVKIFPVYLPEMPDPKGGVGWARKIAMDEAARRLNNEGVIICLDADCTVSENYVFEIMHQFQMQHKIDACSVYFEHVVMKDPMDVDMNIALYEIHLRYLVQAQRWCGHPFAYHTVGSAMAVRRDAYLRQGGMNTRRAGEDFYFLHKFIETGNFVQVNEATVYPSARISARVPFGTGRAMQKAQEENAKFLTTDFVAFRMIKKLLFSLEKLRDFILQEKSKSDYSELGKYLELDSKLISYLKSIHFLMEAEGIVQQTSSLASFQKRFFRYFNAFRMIKYTHYLREHAGIPDIPILEAATHLLDELGYKNVINLSMYEILLCMREMDKQAYSLPETRTL